MVLSIIYGKSYLRMNESTIFQIFSFLGKYLTENQICFSDFCSLILPHFFLELVNVKKFSIF